MIVGTLHHWHIGTHDRLNSSRGYDFIHFYPLSPIEHDLPHPPHAVLENINKMNIFPSNGQLLSLWALPKVNSRSTVPAKGRFCPKLPELPKRNTMPSPANPKTDWWMIAISYLRDYCHTPLDINDVQSLTHTSHVLYIYLHLVDFYGINDDQCR